MKLNETSADDSRVCSNVTHQAVRIDVDDSIEYVCPHCRAAHVGEKFKESFIARSYKSRYDKKKESFVDLRFSCHSSAQKNTKNKKERQYSYFKKCLADVIYYHGRESKAPLRDCVMILLKYNTLRE